MGNEKDFDVIVVGGGVAGICCAGELLLQGLRPLLVCETKQVAHALRSDWIGGNRVPNQLAVFSPIWTGGWWRGLAHRLGASVGAMTAQLPITIRRDGNEVLEHLHPWHLSAAAAVADMEAYSPLPLGDDKEEVQRILDVIQMMPFETLSDLEDITWPDWLRGQNASENTTKLLNYIVALNLVVPLEALNDVTMRAAAAFLRATMFGEAHMPDAVPDFQEGVFVPIAEAIERRGGTIIRGRKVRRVILEDARAQGIILEDGTEFRAGVVALATGIPRLPAFLDPLPPEVAKATSSAWGEHNMMGYYDIALLKDAILPTSFRSWHGVINFDPDWQVWMSPTHIRAPWGVQPGKQILLTTAWLSEGTAKHIGGDTEGVLKFLQETAESQFPGLNDAIEERKSFTRGHMWYSQCFKDARLPRRSETVKGLWYVGDGSRPVEGCWSEAAASAGILGARSIAGLINETATGGSSN